MQQGYMNSNKLKGKIVESETSVVKLAKELNIAPSTLYGYIKTDGVNMPYQVVCDLGKLLNLTKDDMMSIFFTKFVD